MVAPQSTSTSIHLHSERSLRKRVCKACDRCRLKKSKCDGVSPCWRCRADNAICIFGKRKETRDRVYPKGYVEMLEHHRAWLLHGLQELYRRTIDGKGWPGERLKLEPNGHPLIHDLLICLGVLDPNKGDRSEVMPEAMREEPWRFTTGHIQHQGTLNRSANNVQSPIARSRFSSGTFIQHLMSPILPVYISAAPALQIKQVHNIVSILLSMLGEPQQQWANNSGFNPSNKMDPITSTAYPDLSLDAPQMNPLTFDSQMIMSYMSSTPSVDPKSDFEDFSQFLNPSPTDINPI